MKKLIIEIVILFGAVKLLAATTPCPGGEYQHTFTNVVIAFDFIVTTNYQTFCIPNSETPAQFWEIMYPTPTNSPGPVYWEPKAGDLWLEIVSAVPVTVFHSPSVLVTLNCHGLIVGTEYTLFQTTDLNGVNWTNRLDFVATDQTQQIAFYNPPGDQCFFRLWGACNANTKEVLTWTLGFAGALVIVRFMFK